MIVHEGCGFAGLLAAEMVFSMILMAVARLGISLAFPRSHAPAWERMPRLAFFTYF